MRINQNRMLQLNDFSEFHFLLDFEKTNFSEEATECSETCQDAHTIFLL